MSNIRNRRSVRFTAALVVLVLALGALGLVGCGGTVESPGGPSGTGASANVKYVPESVKAARPVWYNENSDWRPATLMFPLYSFSVAEPVTLDVASLLKFGS